MFFKFLDYLRTLPEKKRLQISFWTAGFFTALVVVFWLVNLRARFLVRSEMELTGNAASAPSPLGVIKGGFADLKKSLAEISDNLMDLSAHKATTSDSNISSDISQFDYPQSENNADERFPVVPPKSTNSESLDRDVSNVSE